jgi:thioesterase domain-containing protein
LAGASARGARAVFDVFEANMRAVVAYRPRPLAAPLLVVRATEQATPMHADPHLGWGAWAIGGLATVEVPGSHLTMLEAPAVTKLATILRRYLALPDFEQSEQLASRRNPLPDHVTASTTGPLVVA